MVHDQKAGVIALGIMFISSLVVGLVYGFNGVIWAIAAIDFLVFVAAVTTPRDEKKKRLDG